jgi:hypothetical protein
MVLATTGSVGVRMAPTRTETQKGRPRRGDPEGEAQDQVREQRAADPHEGHQEPQHHDEQPPVGAQVPAGKAEGQPHQGDGEGDERRPFQDLLPVAEAREVDQAEDGRPDEDAHDEGEERLREDALLVDEAGEHR